MVGTIMKTQIQRHESGLVRIIDFSTGMCHSAHPNVQDNRATRRKYPNWTPAWGFRYSPDVMTSTTADARAAKLCKCPSCRG